MRNGSSSQRECVEKAPTPHFKKPLKPNAAGLTATRSVLSFGLAPTIGEKIVV
jgi:hypothetical protein